MEMVTIIWLGLAIAFAVLEALTLGLTSIWFAASAVVMCFVSFTIKCGKPTPLGVGWIALLFFNNVCMFILILYTAYNIIIIWKIIIDTQTQQYL